MNGDTDPTLGLAEVSERFLAAEQRLTELATAAQALTTEAGQLRGARQSVSEVSQAAAGVVIALEGLVGDVRLATQAIQQTDPAAVLARLGGIQTELAEAREQLESAATHGAATQQAVDGLALGVAKNRTMITIAVVAALLAAILSAAALAL